MATGDELARELAESNAAVIAFAETCSPLEWTTQVPGEGWPVAVLVHHIAEGHSLIEGWVGDMLSGAGVDENLDMDAINARHAEDYAGVGVDETVFLLRKNCAGACEAIGSLGPEELEREAMFGPAGRLMSVEQIAGIAARHARGHLSSAKAALGQP
jgi:hypothetical protein